MRVPARLDLVARQNAGFETTFSIFENGVPYDLTGLTGTAIRFQVRAQPGQTGSAPVNNDLTSGVLIVTALQGLVKVNILPATLAAISIPDKFQPLQLYWDLLITPVSSQPFVAVEGNFMLSTGVTR